MSLYKYLESITKFEFNWDNFNLMTDEEKIIHTLEEYDRAIKFYGFDYTTEILIKKGRIGGLCSYSRKVLSVAKWLILENHSDKIENILLHEIAHALTFIHFQERGHGKTWILISKKIGSDGIRCYDPRELNNSYIRNSKYTYVCPNGHEHKKQRISKRIQSCGLCCKKFNTNYIIKLKE